MNVTRHAHRRRLPVAWLLAAAGVSLGASAATTNDYAAFIRAVADGRRTVAEAHWWGYEPADATHALQAAIRSGARRVIVRKMAGPWIVTPIQLADDQELVFEPGVEILAKADAFHGKNDSLFTARSCRNVKLTGPGATLRMRRADYDAPPYTKAEWRHVLDLKSCTNVTVTGLTLAESGGDGIYLGVDRSGAPNRDIVIREVTCDRNYRQGISVISAENLLIEDCVFKDTAGTAPSAGIDFEPNRVTERLVNCTLRRCVAENNAGRAYHFYLGNLAGADTPISIRFEDCRSRGTNRLSLSVYLPMHAADGIVAGRMEFVNCRFEDRGHAGVTLCKPAAGARVRFENCRLSDPAPASPEKAPIVLAARPGARVRLGGVDFGSFTIDDIADRPPLDYEAGGGVPLQDVTGELLHVVNGRTDRIVLDEAWLARVSPPAPFFDLSTPPVKLAALPWDAIPSGAAAPPPHRLRGTSRFALRAHAGERVRLAVRFLAVGKPRGDQRLGVTVNAPSGQCVKRCVGTLGEEIACEFTAPADGVYAVLCDAANHTATVTAVDRPVCLPDEDGTFHFIRTAGTFGFRVPADAGDVGVRVTGSGQAERVAATLIDPAGREVWRDDAIGPPRSYVIPADRAGRAGNWTLRLDKPAQGVFEDHFVELRGIPAVLFFAAGR